MIKAWWSRSQSNRENPRFYVDLPEFSSSIFNTALRRPVLNSGMASGAFECPVCGEDVPAKAKACPHCGACEKAGWNEDARGADGLDLPGDEFNYEKFAREEFGSPTKLASRQLVWKVTAVVILVLMIAATVFEFLPR
jgi:hypothetical protein